MRKLSMHEIYNKNKLYYQLTIKLSALKLNFEFETKELLYLH